ncbi:hypothetical protein BSL78_28326 [Apostichopus japonicus]|uniref:Retrotransposon gag domain-containing protein n=1 Tax=Stichopus japonicus TaxID=307972 RepID=A0A2G8JGK9_STIJA|nr:hypothetical protein BSL78_28326 [Apostichopus japonicus]
MSLQGNMAENFRRFRQSFEIYSIATDLGKKDDAVQSMTLLHVAGPEVVEVYNTFKWDTAGDDKKLGKILEQLEKYCNPRKNVTYERHVFNKRNQQPGESIDTYVTDLRVKAKSCEFAQLTDTLIRDRVVCGITNDAVRARLLRDDKLTLETAIQICRASEISQTQAQSLQENNVTSHIHACQTEKNKRGSTKNRQNNKGSTNKVGSDRIRLTVGSVGAAMGQNNASRMENSA